MSKMNCRSVRREIEEGALGNALSASANDHLRDCPQCSVFREDRLKLRAMLSSLGGVEAPGDFDFRLRARLANEKPGAGQPFVMRNLSFGFRSAAVAATLLLIGSALLFVSLRTAPNNTASTKGTLDPSSGVSQPAANVQPPSTTLPVNAGLPPKIDGAGSINVPEKNASPRRTESLRNDLAAMRGDGVKQRPRTREMGISPAKVLHAQEGTAANGFPIGASMQSLKVSLDNGKGSSRTISLPSVSFGSQRVLSPGSSSLLASARSDW